MKRVALIFTVLGLQAACPAISRPAAAAADDLVIAVRITGAVERSGTYRHPVDAIHACRPALEIPPSPEPGGHFDMQPYEVDFDAAARPPEGSFRLQIRYMDPSPNPTNSDFGVAMTANGQFWQGAVPPLSGTLETPDAGASGRFHIAGLQAAGVAGTITVDGEWTCPH